MNDLFGVEIVEERAPLPPGAKKRKPTLPKGYAAPPGSGPAGETCKTCEHIVRHQMGNTYLKCGRVKWTHGPGTDIRAKAPACRYWEAQKP